MVTSKKRRGARSIAPGPSKAPELLLEGEVVARTRLSRCTIWRLEKKNRFPKRRKIGFKRVAWRTSEIDAWIAGDGEKAAA